MGGFSVQISVNVSPKCHLCYQYTWKQSCVCVLGGSKGTIAEGISWSQLGITHISLGVFPFQLKKHLETRMIAYFSSESLLSPAQLPPLTTCPTNSLS